MSGNSFGKLFRLTTFGESHGQAIGGILEGCPAGMQISADQVQAELDRRKPGQSSITTPRKESDQVQLLSGIFEGRTTGAPIGFLIPNENQQSKDYDHLKDIYRPSHADFTYEAKYGIRDHRGGGRSSARETAARVVAGAIARQLLAREGIKIDAFVQRVGPVVLKKSYHELDLDTRWQNDVRCPDPGKAEEMQQCIEEVKHAGDTVGGIIQCIISGCPAGLGEPVFDKFHALLGQAMLSINAVKGIEFGEGFNAVNFKGSAFNDAFRAADGKMSTASNRSGGIQGGISNGEDILFNIVFKPVSTVFVPQQTVDREGKEVVLKAEGRHDPCVMPRAVPIVEAMAALVTADLYLQNKTSRL